MEAIIVLTAYLAISMLVGGYVYYRGVMTRPVPPVFTTEDQITLGLVAGIIGLLWLLFVPSMVVYWTRWVVFTVQARWRQWSIRLPGELRVRG